MRKISTTKNNNPTDIKVNNIQREQLEQGANHLGEFIKGENMRNNKNQIKHGADAYGIALDSEEITGGAFSFDTYSQSYFFTDLNGVRSAISDLKDISVKTMRRLEQFGFTPCARTKELQNSIETTARKNCFDSAREFVKTLPKWDNEERLETFFIKYAGAPDTAFNRAAGVYFWFSLYARTAGLNNSGDFEDFSTCAGGEYAGEGFKADACVCLLGEKGIGKSKFIKAISPKLDGVQTHATLEYPEDLKFNKLVRNAADKLLVEMPIRLNHDERSIVLFNTLLSQQTDYYRPHSRDGYKIYRRFTIIMTADNPEFMKDRIGNRRYIPINCEPVTKCGECNCLDFAGAERDCLQLWAEAKARFNIPEFQRLCTKLMRFTIKE